MMLRPLIPCVLAAALAGVLAPAAPSAQARAARAMWLWNPKPALTDDSARASLFAFLEREGIGRVWAQVSTEPGPTPRLALGAEWTRLLAEAHRRGIRIEALDGDPTFALKAYHHLTLRVVDALVAHNRAAERAAQFDGLHLDIEPYLLLAWRFPRARETVLHEYLDLMVECRRRLYEFPGMQFGADIPSWWGSIDERTGRPITDVEYEGVRKSATAHLVDRVDNVGIMNYRNTADGPDGLIAHGTDTLAYADGAKAARIWMGVETTRSAPSPVWFVVGLPSAEADRLLQATDAGISREGSFGGYRVRLFDDGLNTHVGLAVPEPDRATSTAPFLAALARLAARFGVLSAAPTAARAAEAQQQALRGFAWNREWEQAEAMAIVDPASKQTYPGVRANSIMLAKLTFAGLSKAAMEKEVGLAEAAFSRHPSYAGLAIHDYDGYRAIATAPPALRPVRPEAIDRR